MATFKEIGQICAQNARDEVKNDVSSANSLQEDTSDQTINKCNIKDRAARVAAAAANIFYWSKRFWKETIRVSNKILV